MLPADNIKTISDQEAICSGRNKPYTRLYKINKVLQVNYDTIFVFYRYRRLFATTLFTWSMHRSSQ